MTATTFTRTTAAMPEFPREGECIDTPLGLVDLVAVRLVLSGRHAELNEAEMTYLAHVLGPVDPTERTDLDIQRRQLAAEGLGLTEHALASRITYRLGKGWTPRVIRTRAGRRTR